MNASRSFLSQSALGELCSKNSLLQLEMLLSLLDFVLLLLYGLRLLRNG